MSQPDLKDYEKDAIKQIYKETFISKTANLVAGIILYVPIIIIWVVFYMFVLTKPFFVNIAPNTRGIIIMAVLIIPIFLAAIFRNTIKNILANKFK